MAKDVIKEAITKVVDFIDLKEDETCRVIEEIMEGDCTSSQVSSLLVGLKMKGESVSEITGAARAMLRKATILSSDRDTVVDLCGTGGDGRGTFNISTTASFVVAGAGVAVAKHGNRSVSSPVGSADVLQALGINVHHSTEIAQKCLDEIGIVFLFAPVYHPAMKNVAQTRKDIGVRTIFNILGPIVNPARVKYQVIGVYSETLLDPIIHVLRNLGHQNAMVVHGADSLDEITVTGKTIVSNLRDGVIKKYQVDPIELGFKIRNIEELKGAHSPKENARMLISILNGDDKGAKRDIVLINAAAAIYVSGAESDLQSGLERAQESLDSGKALENLEQLTRMASAGVSS